jgi:O-antigen ligase
VLVNSALSDGAFMFLSVRRVILVIVLLLFFICLSKFRDKELIIPGRFYFAWFVFIVIDEVVIHNRTLVNMFSILSLFLLSYLLQVFVQRKKKYADRYMLAVTIAFTFITLIAYIEILSGQTFFYSRWVGTERYRNGILRVGSTVSDPNNVCFMLVPFLFLLESDALRKLLPNKIRIIFKILIVGIVFLTSSRAGLVALIVGVVTFLIAKRKAVFLFAVPVIGVASSFVLSWLTQLIEQYGESTSFRYYVIETALRAWIKKPIFGNGGDSISTILNSGSTTNLYNTMNTYIYILMCFGLVGLILFIIYFVFLLKSDVLDWIRNKVPQRDAVLKIASIVSLAILAFTLDTFYMPLMWILPAFFIGMKYYQE